MSRFVPAEKAFDVFRGQKRFSRAFAVFEPDPHGYGYRVQARTKLASALISAALLPRPGVFGTVFLGRTADGGFLVRRAFKVKRGRGGRR
jgi:hypothetical protein